MLPTILPEQPDAACFTMGIIGDDLLVLVPYAGEISPPAGGPAGRWFSESDLGKDYSQPGRTAAAAALARLWQLTGPSSNERASEAGLIGGLGGEVALQRNRAAGRNADPTANAKFDELLARGTGALATLQSALLQRAAATEGHIAVCLSKWADRIVPPPIGDIPESLKQVGQDFAAANLEREPFARRCRIHASVALPPPEPQPPAANNFKPTELRDVLTPTAIRVIRRKLREIRRWHALRLGGKQAMRPRPLALGAEAFQPAAKGRIWDLRTTPPELLDTTAHAFPSHLGLAHLERVFEECVDKELIGMIIHGVVIKAQMAPQIVICPNLLSLYDGVGIDAIADEVDELVKRQWLGTSRFIPFAPWRASPRGAVPRPMGGPPRGVGDLGAPRNELRTSPEGEEVTSVNVATGCGRRQQRLAGDEEAKWTTEDKPRLGDAARNGAILRVPADMSGQTVIAIAFDFKYYFHQLFFSAWEWWKLGAILPTRAEGGGASEAMVCFTEHVMTMGLAPSSQIAQRFANALVQALCKRLDEADREAEAAEPECEAVRAWLEARRELPHDEYGTQARLFDILMYTDDPLIMVVGVERAVRALETLHNLIGPELLNLMYAKDSKWQLSLGVTWQGIGVAAALGIVWVPRAKALRAVAQIERVLAGACTALEYRQLIGFLESLVLPTDAERNTMDHLYGPMRPGAEIDTAPMDPLPEDGRRNGLLRSWQSRIINTPGASLLSYFGAPRAPPGAIRWRPGSDAAVGDVHPDGRAGLGGYMYGHYWHLSTMAPMTIPVAEFCAAIIGLITFYPLLRYARHIILEVDARASVDILQAHHAKSSNMRAAYGCLAAVEEVRQLGDAVSTAHSFGENNSAADRASRLKWADLGIIAEQLNHKLQRVAIPQHATDFLNKVLSACGWGLHREPDDGTADAAAPGGTAIRFAAAYAAQARELDKWGTATQGAAAGREAATLALATAQAAAMRSLAEHANIHDYWATYPMGPRVPKSPEQEAAEGAECGALWEEMHSGGTARGNPSRAANARLTIKATRGGIGLGIFATRSITCARSNYRHNLLPCAGVCVASGGSRGTDHHSLVEVPTSFSTNGIGALVGPIAFGNTACRSCANASFSSPYWHNGALCMRAKVSKPIPAGRQICFAYPVAFKGARCPGCDIALKMTRRGVGGASAAPHIQGWKRYNILGGRSYEVCTATRKSRWVDDRPKHVSPWPRGPAPPRAPAPRPRRTAVEIGTHNPNMDGAPRAHDSDEEGLKACDSGREPRAPRHRRAAERAGGEGSGSGKLQACDSAIRARRKPAHSKQARPPSAEANADEAGEVTPWKPEAASPAQARAAPATQPGVEQAGAPPTQQAASPAPPNVQQARAPPTATARQACPEGIESPTGADDDLGWLHADTEKDAKAIKRAGRELAASKAAVAKAKGIIGSRRGATAKMQQAERTAQHMLGAIRADKSRLALRPADDDALALSCLTLVNLLQSHVAHNTAANEASNWKHWVKFCESMGTPPWRDDGVANSGGAGHEREVNLLALGLLQIYHQMQPALRTPDKPLKPSSAILVLRGVRRLHKRMGYTMVDLGLAVRLAAALADEYVQEHGPESLSAHRTEPVTNEMVDWLVNAPSGTRIPVTGEIVDDNSLATISMRACFATMARTGFRADEVSLREGIEFTKKRLARWNLRWKVGVEWIYSPTAAQLGDLKDGDYAVLIPACSKADQLGLEWGPNPIWLRFSTTEPVNAARELAKLERAYPVEGEMRRIVPLFVTAAKKPISSTRLRSYFRDLLRAKFTEEEYSRVSPHSFRVYLACALLKLKRSHAQIQALLRWKTDEALRIYARLDATDYADLLSGVGDVAIDQMRAHNLPQFDPALQLGALLQARVALATTADKDDAAAREGNFGEAGGGSDAEEGGD